MIYTIITRDCKGAESRPIDKADSLREARKKLKALRKENNSDNPYSLSNHKPLTRYPEFRYTIN